MHITAYDTKMPQKKDSYLFLLFVNLESYTKTNFIFYYHICNNYFLSYLYSAFQNKFSSVFDDPFLNSQIFYSYCVISTLMSLFDGKIYVYFKLTFEFIVSICSVLFLLKKIYLHMYLYAGIFLFVILSLHVVFTSICKCYFI